MSCVVPLPEGGSSGGNRRVSFEPDMQLNKWGFMPGGDDTMELNLMHKGAFADRTS